MEQLQINFKSNSKVVFPLVLGEWGVELNCQGSACVVKCFWFSAGDLRCAACSVFVAWQRSLTERHDLREGPCVMG